MKLKYSGSGKIFYKDKEYKCDLYINQRHGGILIKIYYMKNFGSYLELPLEIDCLFGQLDNGFLFTLYELLRSQTKEAIGAGKTEYTYSAGSMLCGVGGEAQEECNLHKVSYTLSDIIEWGEISIYGINKEFNIFNQDGPNEKMLYQNGELTIAYHVYGSILPVTESQLLKEKIMLRQHGAIVIQSQEEKPITFFNELFKKVKDLIGIALLEKVHVESVRAYSREVYDAHGDDRYERKIDVYGSGIGEPSKKDNYAFQKKFSWISISELVEYNSFETFFEKYEKLEPILELYTESVSTKGSARRNFLNGVQALETYHARFITDKFAEFKDQVERIIESIPDKKKDEYREFLLAGSEKSSIALRSRLAFLQFTMERSFFFDTGDIKRSQFPQVIKDTRNYYIHYNEDKRAKRRILTEEELGIYNRAIFFLLEYFILKELGFTDDVALRKKLTDRWGNISQDLNILKASREMN